MGANIGKGWINSSALQGQDLFLKRQKKENYNQAKPPTMIRYQSFKKGVIMTNLDYRNVLDIANRYWILFDGGIKVLKSKNDFIYWGYLPDKKENSNYGC